MCTKHFIPIMQESGVPFIVNGKKVNLNGTLILGCGDNPAAYLMAGYKSLTSAFRKCRTCMATSYDIQTKVLTQFAHTVYACMTIYLSVCRFMKLSVC